MKLVAAIDIIIILAVLNLPAGFSFLNTATKSVLTPNDNVRKSQQGTTDNLTPMDNDPYCQSDIVLSTLNES